MLRRTQADDILPIPRLSLLFLSSPLPLLFLLSFSPPFSRPLSHSPPFSPLAFPNGADILPSTAARSSLTHLEPLWQPR